MRKNLLKALFFILLFIGVERFCHSKTAGFTLAKIQKEIPYSSEWEVENGPVELFDILDQKFTFLGRGNSCFAFESQNKKYVIKFFNLPHLTPRFPWASIEATKKRITKLNRCFKSFKIAYHELKEETGLLYLHLNQTKGALPTITLVDKLGIHHQVDLNKTPFLIQKRGELALDRINRLMKENDVASAKKSVLAMVAQMRSICLRGIHNRDINFRRNYAFVNDRPLLIDVGPLSQFDPAIKQKKYSRKLRAPLSHLKEWLQINHPSLYREVESEF